MHPGPSPIIAQILTVVAVLALVGAVLVITRTARVHRGLVRRRETAALARDQVRRLAADVRAELDRSTVVLTRVDRDMQQGELTVQRLSRALTAQRESIERVTQGRTARIMRLVHLVTRAAQFAFLWR